MGRKGINTIFAMGLQVDFWSSSGLEAYIRWICLDTFVDEVKVGGGIVSFTHIQCGHCPTAHEGDLHRQTILTSKKNQPGSCRRGGGGQREGRGATVHTYSSFVHGGKQFTLGSKIPTMSECISSL
jgi:hypothetical protein